MYTNVMRAKEVNHKRFKCKLCHEYHNVDESPIISASARDMIDAYLALKNIITSTASSSHIDTISTACYSINEGNDTTEGNCPGTQQNCCNDANENDYDKDGIVDLNSSYVISHAPILLSTYNDGADYLGDVIASAQGVDGVSGDSTGGSQRQTNSTTDIVTANSNSNITGLVTYVATTQYSVTQFSDHPEHLQSSCHDHHHHQPSPTCFNTGSSSTITTPLRPPLPIADLEETCLETQFSPPPPPTSSSNNNNRNSHQHQHQQDSDYPGDSHWDMQVRVVLV